MISIKKNLKITSIILILISHININLTKPNYQIIVKIFQIHWKFHTLIIHNNDKKLVSNINQ